MADVVTIQVIEDGPKRAVIKLTNQSDGTGETLVKKVDLATLSGAPARVSIDRIWAATSGMSVDLVWEGATSALATTIPDLRFSEIDFRDFGGLSNTALTPTGNILLSTGGASVGDRYTVILYLKKN